MNNNMKLNRIKEVLDEKGISQTWLAKKLGKSFNTVNGQWLCMQSVSAKSRNTSPNIFDIGN